MKRITLTIVIVILLFTSMASRAEAMNIARSAVGQDWAITEGFATGHLRSAPPPVTRGLDTSGIRLYCSQHCPVLTPRNCYDQNPIDWNMCVRQRVSTMIGSLDVFAAQLTQITQFLVRTSEVTVSNLPVVDVMLNAQGRLQCRHPNGVVVNARPAQNTALIYHLDRTIEHGQWGNCNPRAVE
ncbi:MAG: hypothetical protein WBA93_19625 [Microcoleaceae cyanobacterium]